jgi:heterotetrameric sarcosine oxidase gamma subunit
MATTDTTVLAALSPATVAGLATLWPKSSPAFTLRVVETTQVLSLRHLPGGGAATLGAMLAGHAAAALPDPGRCCGSEPRLIWRSPSEILLLTEDPTLASVLLAARLPAPRALACALDLSSGTLHLVLQGSGVHALLSRLVDAQALPREAGQASRMRLADIAAVVWREAPDRVGVLVDRTNDHYLAHWLRYAADALCCDDLR